MEEMILSGRLPNGKKSITQKTLHNRKKEFGVEVLTYFFILLFTYTSLRKLVNYEMFVKEISGYTFFRSNTKWALAVLIGTEIITVFFLVIPKMQLRGFQLSFGVLTVLNIFSFIILQVCPSVMPLLYGGILPSFSNDGIPTFSFFDHLIFNMIMLFLSLIALLLKSNLERQIKLQRS